MRSSSVLATIFVALLASTAMADPGTTDDDAGSGVDAGNTRKAALLVEYARTYGGRVRGNDVDWYEAHLAASGASCVRVTASTTAASYFTLGGENADGTTVAPILIGEGAKATGGIAGRTPSTSTLRIARQPNVEDGGPGHYQFQLDRVSITNAPDSGTSGDAGASPAEAALVAPGCIGGHLSAIGSMDMADVYQVSAGAGEVLTYSLSSSTGGHTLSLLDAAGRVIGPVLESGQLANVQLSTSGSYFLAAQRTTAIGDVGYLVGAVVGPEPSTCRPYCLG